MFRLGYEVRRSGYLLTTMNEKNVLLAGACLAAQLKGCSIILTLNLSAELQHDLFGTIGVAAIQRVFNGAGPLNINPNGSSNVDKN